MIWKIGFGEIIIHMVYRLICNNWYSILLNVHSKGFFRSSRGVKQGDPLSPNLFILAAEVMSRALNYLIQREELKCYGMPRGSRKVNHLAFADDMIIICKAEVRTMQLITETLKKYEDISGQNVNKEKSTIYLHHNVWRK